MLRKVDMVPGNLPIFGARGAPVTCITLLDLIFREQTFGCLNQFMGKPFPAAALSVSKWPCKCWSCERRFSMPFLNLGDWTMESLGCRFVVAATGATKVGFSWSHRRRDMVSEDLWL